MLLQARAISVFQTFSPFGLCIPGPGSIRAKTLFKPKPIVPYGVKAGRQYHIGRVMTRKAAVKARKIEAERGILLDPKKEFRMELKRNEGIGWYRSLQVCKHLEMHERSKGPPVDQALREKTAELFTLVKSFKKY